MAQPSRRQHERYPCHFNVTLVAAGAKAGEGRLADVGLGGAALETFAELKRGVSYEIFFVWNMTKVRLPFTVAWDKAPDAKGVRRYGLAFSLSAAQLQTYRAVIDSVRREGGDDGAKPMRDYWSV